MLTRDEKNILSTVLRSNAKNSLPLNRVNNYSSTARKLNSNWVAPRVLNYDTNPYRFINQSERARINQYALDLFRSSPLINAAITRKNEWACATGFMPNFKGKDSPWGILAMDFLKNEVLPTCNTAGPNYSWNRTLLTIANQLDIMGDVLLVFVPTDNGFRLAVYPSSIVGQRDQTQTTVEDGRYRGSEIDNGVIYSTRLGGFPVAYNILQDTVADDFTYSIREAQLFFEPNELCKRGISCLASPLIALLDNQDTAGYISRGVKMANKLPIVVNTETGTGEDFVSDGPGETTTGTANSSSFSTTPNVVDFSDYTFFKAGTGEKFEIPNANNPSTNAVEWIRYMSEECCTALGWPIGLLHASQLGNSTSGKMIESQVQNTIAVRQQTLMRIAQLFVTMNLAKAMETGRLPRVNDDSWRNAFEFSLPPEFTIDSWYAEQGDLQGLKSGTKTLQQVVARNGGNWEEVVSQRKLENKRAIDDAVELVSYAKSKGETLTFAEARDMGGNAGKVAAAPLQTQVVAQGE